MALLEIATNKNSVSAAKIAEKQKISTHYLEQILLKLKKAHLIKSTKGPHGGYSLNSDISEITILDILTAINENIIMTKCGKSQLTMGCHNNGTKCATHDLWHGLEIKIRDYFKNFPLSRLIT